ncbi:putative iron(III) ABC transporter, fused inner membrane subunits [Oceanicola granulosus HTCC2516]|uniref:Putative iron(III) ABC transporter, fused inner membrane subunits n=1 Tax=Oceanicola granulosus (strain ATCC BAA-861 / DSM 15982 / KCTC 12143 / HTCC2516) TaxID=314256 RepID=Q2CJG1_OCEGH|nr:iron ABC transporter permease [Oceanicola granulosus]EAR52639.1 putative iron(III) ABC transporter, fused inner membrane subunits [Oceanicola granulosus HTCC2516]
MSEGIRQPLAAARRRPDGWSLGAAVIAAVVLLPIVAVVWFALHPEENIWPHLVATTLPRYLGNTALLMLATGALTAAMGTGAAWLVVMYRFPGRRWLQWALLAPLAVPAYVGAYALADFLEYAGPVQTALRELMGWQSARDYWFPEIRSRGAAILVFSAALYPYVYILARAALREQSGAGFEVARALGAGPLSRFFRVGLPLMRPAAAAGVAIVMMETVNDFGTVDYFAVQTLTTGIFSVWLQSGNLGGAAQIATLSLSLIVLLVLVEKISRRKSRTFQTARQIRPVIAEPLPPRLAWAATLACLIPVAWGFLLPVAVITSHALDAAEWAAPGLVRALWHTVVTGGIAAVLCVGGGLFMVYGVRLSGRRLPILLMPVTAIGYAAPGAVLALGILIPLARLDNALADAWVALTGFDPGLLLTGSAAALILAYVVRFFAIGQGAADAALGRISPSLPMAARSLGRSAGGTLRAVHLPLVRASVGSALLLVFVDCVKELPATLLLRPFNYDTLATRVHEKASLENIAEAAPAALMITALGLVAVALLARANR